MKQPESTNAKSKKGSVANRKWYYFQIDFQDTLRTNQCLLSDTCLMVTPLQIISFERDFTQVLIVQQLLAPSIFPTYTAKTEPHNPTILS